jgi:hypothetical protein
MDILCKCHRCDRAVELKDMKKVELSKVCPYRKVCNYCYIEIMQWGE